MREPEKLAIERVGLARDTLAGQVAVVTGGGRGIGREIARAFAWLGASVVIAEISDTGMETERIVKEAGGAALFAKTDVSREADVALLVRRTEEMFGPAGILINNAILAPVASVLELDVTLWDRVIAVNLRGALLTCKAFLPGMLARKHGVIVNMISTDAMPYLSAYIASKQGLIGLSQSLAAEVGESGVRVIAFGPGLVDTPGLRNAAQLFAPRIGMSPDQFFRMSVHPAYEGMMPAGDAAAAAAYLVAALAEEYHGEQVDGYTVLERAGFLETPVPAIKAVAQAEPVAVPTADRAEAVRHAVALSEQLQEFVAQTDAEFDKLPVFVRSIARRGFKGKAGQSIQDWARTAANLTEQLKRMEAQDVTAGAAFRAGYPRLKELLGKLTDYCQAVPGETARFVKDADMLRTVTQAMAEREASIRSLIAAIEAIQA